MSKNILKVSINHYTFDIDYYRDNSNCSCDYICRCSRLVDVKIKSKPEISDFVVEYKKSNSKSLYKFTEIENYCIERILAFYKFYDVSLYDVDICQSYYGEEISGISFDNLSLVKKSIEEMLEKNSPLSQVMYVLDLEYSFIPKNLQEVNMLTVEGVNISDIASSSGQMQLIKRNNDIIYDSISGIRGVLLNSHGRYSLVDGHHRLQFDISSNNTTNTYIVLK